MNPNNSDQADDDITNFGRSVPMQGFYGGWNPGLQPSAQQYPYVPGGWTAALNQGFMPFPIPPPSPTAPAQNQPLATTVESVEPTVMKESQGDGEGGSLPTGRRRKVVPSLSKLSNFSPKEDVFLVKSWLEISCDPITNTGQKKERFWDRVTSQYDNKRGSYPQRSFRSLQSRWETIKAEASKFAGYMTNVLRDNPSGMTDADKTSLALANFAGIELYSFVFMHCWDLLKDEPKWMELNSKGAQNEDDDGIADHIPPACNNIDLDQETPSSQSSGSKRPMGRDAAKRAAKKSASSMSDSSQYVSKMQDHSIQKLSIWQQENKKKGSRYEEMAAIDSQRYDELCKHNQHLATIEEEKLQLMRKKADILQTHEEERILGIDLDKQNPRLRKYYEAKQEEIMRRIEGNLDP